MVKLQDIEKAQKLLSEEFKKIHKNVDEYGKMFKFESDGKKSLAKEIISQKEIIEKMATMLGKQKQINRDS